MPDQDSCKMTLSSMMLRSTFRTRVANFLFRCASYSSIVRNSTFKQKWTHDSLEINARYYTQFHQVYRVTHKLCICIQLSVQVLQLYQRRAWDVLSKPLISLLRSRSLPLPLPLPRYEVVQILDISLDIPNVRFYLQLRSNQRHVDVCKMRVLYIYLASRRQIIVHWKANTWSVQWTTAARALLRQKAEVVLVRRLVAFVFTCCHIHWFIRRRTSTVFFGVTLMNI